MKYKYLKKVEARTEGVHFIMRALFQTLGNKRYLHDLEKLLNDRLR